MATFHHTLSLLQHDTGYLDMAFGWLVKGRGYHLGVDGACHIGHLLRALVYQEHHEVGLGMVGCDSVGNVFHQDGLTCLGLCHDECALTFTDRREEVYNTCREVGSGTVATEREFLVGEKRCEMLEWDAVTHIGGLTAVDLVDTGKWEILLALFGRTDVALHYITGLQAVMFDLGTRHIDIIW